MAASRICSIDDCGKLAKARGWCNMHYKRWVRNGDPVALYVGPARSFFENVVLLYEGDECLTWPFATDANGYGKIGDGNDVRLVSRQVCERVYGAPPTPKHEAAHSCGKGHKGCCAKRHLSWATRQKNQMDRVDHGTSNRGERQWQSKLTEQDVLMIRSMAGSQRAIAAEYNIRHSTVGDIQRRKIWAWLPD